MDDRQPSWSRFIPTWLLPSPCLACGRQAEPGAPHLGLCARCRGRLEEPGANSCSRCGRVLSGARLPPGFLCGRCRKRPPAFERLYAAWLYQAPFDDVIRALKFGRLEYLGRALGAALAARFATTLPPVDLVVPVPLHWRRRLSRGFNQAAAIGASFARARHLPCRSLLRRKRATQPQSRLPRARRLANLRHAFALRRRRSLAGLSILLIDDVSTTGATLDAAARALRHAGAQRVLAMVAARTPD